MNQSINTIHRSGRAAWGVLATALLAASCSTTPKPAHLAGAQAGPPPPRVVCADLNFTIYFEKGSDQLTAPARQEITYAAARVKGCRLGAVEVLGLADADGAAHRNLVLSRRRAVVVAEALANDGLPAPSFDIEAIGKSGATTEEGEPEPLRRKTEVVIRASPPAAPPHS
jgi:peptidoglycan-associated lipoprotein